MNTNPGRSGATLTRWAALAACTVALAAASLLVTPSPAQAADTYRFVPISLTAVDQQDPPPEPSDEISLRYGGVDFRPASMSKNSKVLPPPVTFTGSSLLVELWELDQGWSSDDFLGSLSVYAAVTGPTTHRFYGPDWWSGCDYVLEYRVESVTTTTTPTAQKEVPYVIDMTEGDASLLLRDQGFRVTTRYVQDCNIRPGTVTGQNPAAGRLVPAGSTVTIYVTYLPDGYHMC